jgi:hypothetical protein
MKSLYLCCAIAIAAALALERRFPLFKSHSLETAVWAFALCLVRLTLFIIALYLLVEARKP